MNRLDKWWKRTNLERRYDHGPMYVYMLIAIWSYGFSLAMIGPPPGGAVSDLTEFTQRALAFITFAGATICLLGSASGSRFVFPKFSLRQSYGTGLVGIPFLASSLAYYGIVVAVNSANATSTLGAAVGLFLSLGAIHNGVYFWLEIRRIARNAQHIVAIRNQKDSQDDGP